jgi:hypothetical protein
MKRWLCLIWAVVISASAAAPAGAAVVLTTFSGVVRGGVDVRGLFGGGIVQGDTFVAVFHTDTATPGAIFQTSPYSSGIYGGILAGSPSPTSAMVSLYDNARLVGSLNLAGDYYGSNFKSSWISRASPNFLESIATDRGLGVRLDLAIRNGERDSPELSDPHWWAPVDWDVSPLGYLGNQTVGNLGTLTYALNGDDGASFSLVAQHVRVETLGPIPEPSSWALMLLGAGITGLVLRRPYGARKPLSPPQPVRMVGR